MRTVLATVCIVLLMCCIYRIGHCAAEIKFCKIMQRTIQHINPNGGDFARGAFWVVDYIRHEFDKTFDI